jgi:transcriptional regulator with XRE-family HTH domain
VYPTRKLVERRTVDRIRHARRRLGLSQEELAEASGVSAATIVQVELGNRRPQGRTLRKLAAALGVEVADLLEEEASPKAESRSSLEPTLFYSIEDERRLRYLRSWRAFVNRLARRWEEEPPKTSAEITPLFEAMAAAVEAGVFEPSGVTDAAESDNLFALTIGFKRLNDIADKVEKDEEAEQRRATLRLIQGRLSA